MSRRPRRGPRGCSHERPVTPPAGRRRQPSLSYPGRARGPVRGRAGQRTRSTSSPSVWSEQVAVAVHPYEVAALLESDGLTGDQITARYGRPDLFTLAEDLTPGCHATIPEPPPAPDPWRPDHLRCALRGLVFALPGLAYVLGAGLWHGTADVSGLIASRSCGLGAGTRRSATARICGWRPERKAAAGRTLRIGAPAGALGGRGHRACWCRGQARARPSRPGSPAISAAASVLLVLGRERAAAAHPVARRPRGPGPCSCGSSRQRSHRRCCRRR